MTALQYEPDPPAELLASERVVSRVLDAYAEVADPDGIAMRTGLSAAQVRAVLADKELVRLAIRRKAVEFMLWSVGPGMDIIKEVAREGSHSQKLQAVRLAKEFAQSIFPAFDERSEVVVPSTLEDAVAEADQL